MSENPDSFNPRSYAMPDVPQAVGELVVELLAQEPDAIVIDRPSLRILVYPKGSASDRPVMDADSLPSLLSSYEINMLPRSIADVTELLHSEPAETHVALFHHPALNEQITCQTPHYSSKILAPHFLLLCIQDSSQSSYRLIGATMDLS